MSAPVEGRGAEQPVGEGVAPLGEVEVGGDDGGALFVALGDEVVEVLVLRCSQGFQTEVLVQSWPEIARLARQEHKPEADQATLFAGEES